MPRNPLPLEGYLLIPGIFVNIFNFNPNYVDTPHPSNSFFNHQPTVIHPITKLFNSQLMKGIILAALRTIQYNLRKFK
jgi:hypothetical protein